MERVAGLSKILLHILPLLYLSMMINEIIIKPVLILQTM
jgi:hypothetical protein